MFLEFFYPLHFIVHWIDRIPDNYEDLQRQGSSDFTRSWPSAGMVRWSLVKAVQSIASSLTILNGKMAAKLKMNFTDFSAKSLILSISTVRKWKVIIFVSLNMVSAINPRKQNINLRNYFRHIRTGCNDCSISSIESISKIWSLAITSNIFSTKYCWKSSTQIISNLLWTGIVNAWAVQKSRRNLDCVG